MYKVVHIGVQPSILFGKLIDIEEINETWKLIKMNKFDQDNKLKKEKYLESKKEKKIN